MAKSKARKHREKMIREGKRNPVENRGIYVLADMRTRRTKTKAEKLQQQKYKGRISYHDKEDFDLFTFYRYTTDPELQVIERIQPHFSHSIPPVHL